MIGEAGVAQHRLDGQRALRNVRGVLEQSDVSGHQRGGGETKHLPERKVPRHHRQNGAHRLIADVTLLRLGLDRLVGEVFRSVIGVVAAGERALLHLGDCRLDRFSHLHGDQASEVARATVEQFGGAAHAGGALVE